MGADAWGGSLGITSDYIVRGISRTNEQPRACRSTYTILSASGFVAGLFASNTQFDPGSYGRRTRCIPRLCVDFAGTTGAAEFWRVIILILGIPAGSGYDYDEFDVSLAFQEWLNATLAYSPNAWRYVRRPAPSSACLNEAAEVDLQRPIFGKLSATAGIGYSHLAGPPAPEGYAFWSLGGAYDLAPVSISLSYVKTTAGAKALFYNAAGTWRWTGTVIWRF